MTRSLLFITLHPGTDHYRFRFIFSGKFPTTASRHSRNQEVFRVSSGFSAGSCQKAVPPNFSRPRGFRQSPLLNSHEPIINFNDRSLIGQRRTSDWQVAPAQSSLDHNIHLFDNWNIYTANVFFDCQISNDKSTDVKRQLEGPPCLGIASYQFIKSSRLKISSRTAWNDFAQHRKNGRNIDHVQKVKREPHSLCLYWKCRSCAYSFRRSTKEGRKKVIMGIMGWLWIECQ